MVDFASLASFRGRLAEPMWEANRFRSTLGRSGSSGLVVDLGTSAPCKHMTSGHDILARVGRTGALAAAHLGKEKKTTSTISR